MDHNREAKFRHKYLQFTRIFRDLQEHVLAQERRHLWSSIEHLKSIQDGIALLNKCTVNEFDSYELNADTLDALYSLADMLEVELGQKCFQHVTTKVKEIIQAVGFPSIKGACEFLKVGISPIKLIGFYDSYFCAVSYHTVAPNTIEQENKPFSSEQIYVTRNTTMCKDVLLDNQYDLHIIHNNVDHVFAGYFREDNLQMNSRILVDEYNVLQRRHEVINLFANTVDKPFLRKYAKYARLHEITTMLPSAFQKYVEDKHAKFLEINNRPFPDLMRDFIGKHNDLFNMFETIRLLLHGSEESVGLASSLYSLLNERKIHAQTAADIIYYNLPFVHQVKLNRSQKLLQAELERLGEIGCDALDLKKQVTLNKRIPSNVRSMMLEKINEMKLNNNDYYKQQLYVKTLLNYPWPSSNDVNLFTELRGNNEKAAEFLTSVEAILDKATYGHSEVKEQVSLLLAKWIKQPTSGGAAIGLVGPPGVGKTIVAKSLGTALNLPFVQITLGGQNDGEILHGHGYTYSGAQPGLIIRKMIEAGKSRCIMYFDELDKTCAKHGMINEISSILIHLTDPNINGNFQDRFFQGIDFSLSNVLFVFSYNDADKIDPILLDRFVQIKMQPYSLNDKIQIAEQHIVPELIQSIGLPAGTCIERHAILDIILNFTSEAGVRDLKRRLEHVLLNANRKNMLGTLALPCTIREHSFDPCERVSRMLIGSKSIVGATNALFASDNGNGGIIRVQVSKTRKKSKDYLHITGSVGEIMRESINVAHTLACIWSGKEDRHQWHIHLPTNAMPKDGPSAGCAITLAFLSHILNKPFKHTYAVTGEIDLHGNICKVGGIEQKLIGAKLAGVHVALVPTDNKYDVVKLVSKIPELIDTNFHVKYISTIDEAINITLCV